MHHVKILMIFLWERNVHIPYHKFGIWDLFRGKLDGRDIEAGEFDAGVSAEMEFLGGVFEPDAIIFSEMGESERRGEDSIPGSSGYVCDSTDGRSGD
jgi:hypothetical protein